MQQTTLFGDRFAENKARRWAEIRARQDMVRRRAGQAAANAFHEWFRQRAREFGGLTAQNRAQVIAECEAKARQAKRDVYLAHGYALCGMGDIADPCQALVSPGFDACPDHTPISAS